MRLDRLSLDDAIEALRRLLAEGDHRAIPENRGHFKWHANTVLPNKLS